ncbi:MAG: hypothetical protein OHK0046_40370 [Anaerolineae bacterium]
MNENNNLSHPKTPAEYLRIFFTGFAMGSADIVPGVSGGTMAFILGIYETLLDGIKSFNLTAIRHALKFDFKALFQHVPIRFLIALGLGILAAILVLSDFLHHELETRPTYVFAFFAGLIVASIVAVGVKVKWAPGSMISFTIATIFAFWLVGLPLLDDAGHSPLVLFLSGAVAICAMILPGISGSFILLVLGQYEYVLAAAKDLDIITLIPVVLGCAVGILAFSRVVSYLLKNYHNVTVAALVGFMVGAMRMIWDEAAAGVVLLNPSGSLDAGQIVIVLALILIGFFLVTIMDHLQSGTNPVLAPVWKPRRPTNTIAEKAAALD